MFTLAHLFPSHFDFLFWQSSAFLRMKVSSIVFVGFAFHETLADQSLERLRKRGIEFAAEEAIDETGIEQVQDGMLNAANVETNWLYLLPRHRPKINLGKLWYPEEFNGSRKRR